MIKSYLRTFKAVFSNPRDVINPFVHNEKSIFMHPFKFLLIGVILVSGLNTLLVNFSFTLDATDLDLISDSEQAVQIAEAIQSVNILASTQFLPLAVMVLLVPMLTLGGLIFLRESTDGFYHNLILNCYAAGGTIIFLVFLIPFWIFSGLPLTDSIANTYIPGAVVAVGVIWVYINYLLPDTFLGRIRVISAYATGYIFYIFMSGFVSGVIGYMIFVINRIRELSGS